jgi:hypothetical protein
MVLVCYDTSAGMALFLEQDQAAHLQVTDENTELI